MRPVLYSFRRCPYAMRARLALAASGIEVELREIVLRDKPAAFLATSPSATVPCLLTNEGVIDESLDIMTWALEQNDPSHWLEMPQQGWQWIKEADGPFKRALDRCKYVSRYPESDPQEERARAKAFLSRLDAQIDHWIFAAPRLADYALLPFVRQFAFIDKAWFDAQPWPKLQAWLEHFLNSDEFARIMQKHPQWEEGTPGIVFPPKTAFGT